MKILIPLILAVLGVVGGGAVGYVLRPAPEAAAEAGEGADKAHGEAAEGDHADGGETHAAEGEHGKGSDSEYSPIERKLIVPFVRASGRKAFVAIDITLEMGPQEGELAKKHEPKIVDAFLRTVVGFAATGAFDDTAAAAHTLRELNGELLKAARGVLGGAVRAVLISNLLTQDA